MTNRLKELLPNPFTTDYQYKYGPLDLYTEEIMLAYAKRILNECIIEMNKLSGDFDGDATTSLHTDNIKTHFGLNEDNQEFTYDLDKMKIAIESERIAIPVEVYKSFEMFDNWINEGSMNGKIKKLAYQANLLDDDGWNTTNLSLSTDKFAKLIIQDCIDVIKDSNGDEDYAIWVLEKYLQE